jgi:dihydroorotate dehydrogenase electron transfer subunit
MLWIPTIDEIPLSITNSEKDKVAVVVKAVGKATKTLHRFKKGRVIGIRGPFGNNFTENPNKILLIGGGTGIVPLYFLAKKMIKKIKKLTFIIGAKTKDDLLFLNELIFLCKKQNIISTTEDGSFGLKCIATKPLNKLLSTEDYDMIYACGPELMIRNVFDIAEKNNLPMEASLERLMRCGIGLCGSCSVGKYRVCKDGPVFDSKKLREIKHEFGRLKLDNYGKLISI